ncbi:hypothetical protein C0991_000702, partial [Blastosporella zonata]
ELRAKQEQASPGKGDFRRVFVDNIHPSMTRNEFVHLLSDYGSVQSVVLPFNEEGKSLGYASVIFATDAEAQLAINMLHGSVHHGKKLVVYSSQPPAGRLKVCLDRL